MGEDRSHRGRLEIPRQGKRASELAAPIAGVHLSAVCHPLWMKLLCLHVDAQEKRCWMAIAIQEMA